MLQVDTLEVIRHPEETTNMKRQTMASYFRVWNLLDLYSACLQKGLATLFPQETQIWQSHWNESKAQESVKKIRGMGREKIIAGNLPLSTALSHLNQMKTKPQVSTESRLCHWHTAVSTECAGFVSIWAASWP